MRVYAEDLGTLTHTVQKNGVAGRKIAQDWSCARIARSSLVDRQRLAAPLFRTLQFTAMTQTCIRLELMSSKSTALA
jgi:hypothetical protein